MGNRNLVPGIPHEHHTARSPRHQTAITFTPAKEKACPHVFQAQISDWPPNVTVGRIKSLTFCVSIIPLELVTCNITIVSI